MAQHSSPGRKPLRVVIIGAGFAGLSAGRSLQPHQEVSVTILESSQEVGGRAKAGKLPSGAKVEFGATWFHGVRDNPVYDMAVWQGVVKDCRCDPEAQKHEIDWQLHFARPQEGQLLAGDLKRVALEAVGRYTEAAEECTQGAQLGDGTVGDVIRRTFDEVISMEGLQGEVLNTFADAWHFREKLQRTFDGFYSTDDVSLAFAREYETLEGPNMPIPGGCQALAAILAQGLDIHFGHAVTCIEYGPNGARVTCANGAVFECDCVLITTSLGVLQRNHQAMFHPPLPQWKQDAMSALRIGVADKLFIEWEIQPERTRDAAAWLITHASTPSTTQLGDPPSGHAGSFSAQGGPHPQLAASPAAEDSSASEQAPAKRHSSPSGQAVPARSPAQGVLDQYSAPLIGASPESERATPLHGAASSILSEDSSVSAASALGASKDGQQPAQPAATSATWGGMGWRNIPSGTSLGDGAPALGPSASAAAQQRAQRVRRKHKRAIHSYAFLWPVSDPHLLGASGHPAQVLGPQALTSQQPICCDQLQLAPIPRSPAVSYSLPSWVQGLHSLRYCPGPEWIQPSHLQSSSSATVGSGSGNGRGKRSHAGLDSTREDAAASAPDGGTTHISGVLWVTGNAALQMEAASTEELEQGVTGLFQLFPQVPVPPGAIMPPRVVRTNWGTDPHHLGSYTYINVLEQSGEAVDALAEPLCNDQGVPIVLFAGEATHRQYIGTVHGAFLSGYREAERLLDLLRAHSPSVTAVHEPTAADCHAYMDTLSTHS